MRARLANALICFQMLACVPPRSAGPMGKTTEKTVLGMCYSVRREFLGPIDRLLGELREEVRSQKRSGKIVGFVSIPLTSRGGGYRPLNSEVSEAVNERLRRRFGERFWVLSPGLVRLDPIKGARPSGAEYMLMWTRLFGGEDGLGREFDMIYFVGPDDFRLFFGLNGAADLARLEQFANERAKRDAGFREAVTKSEDLFREFLIYYGLRASVAFSRGSQDEWNIFNRINERRRDHPDFGFGRQVAVFFDGRAVDPGGASKELTSGYASACP